MSDQAPEILLAHHLKALKLPTCLREHHKLARQCAAEGVDHIRFLARLVEMEMRSEEHTSELQSLMRISYAVFCLKKKNKHKDKYKRHGELKLDLHSHNR